MFSITALVRPDPFNGPETHCDLGLQSKVSCDMGLSPVFRTRESMTPVPFYCIFFLMQRQKAEFVFISFCKAPPYVSGLQLRRMQVFGSHAGSTKDSALPSSPDRYLLEPTERPKESQASCGVWREDSVLLSMPGRKQVPHLVMTGAALLLVF